MIKAYAPKGALPLKNPNYFAFTEDAEALVVVLDLLNQVPLSAIKCVRTGLLLKTTQKGPPGINRIAT